MFSGEGGKKLVGCEAYYAVQLSGKIEHKQSNEKIVNFINFIANFDKLSTKIVTLCNWIQGEYFMHIKQDNQSKSHFIPDIIDFLDTESYEIKMIKKLSNILKENPDYKDFIAKISPQRKDLINNSITQLNSQLSEIGLNKYHLKQIEF